MDLALNNLQRLICHKTQQTKPNLSMGQITVYLFNCMQRDDMSNWIVSVT